MGKRIIDIDNNPIDFTCENAGFHTNLAALFIRADTPSIIETLESKGRLTDHEHTF